MEACINCQLATNIENFIMDCVCKLRHLLIYTLLFLTLISCVPSWVWSGDYKPSEDPEEVAETLKATDRILNNSPLRGYRPGNSVEAKVVRVISGDTIEVEIEGERLIVGYIGVDAPKFGHSILGTEPFGKEAFERNKEVVEGMTVSLEVDLFEADNQGRALRYVFLDDLMVNALILHEGLAQATGNPPAVKYAEVLYEVQNQAMVARRGGWRTEWQNLLRTR